MARSPEEKEESRQVRELKKQLSKLKKDNAALRKKLLRTEHDLLNYMDILEDQEYFEPKPQVTEKSTKPHCPKCSSDSMSVFTIMDAEYFKCDDCGSKGKIK